MHIQTLLLYFVALLCCYQYWLYR